MKFILQKFKKYFFTWRALSFVVLFGFIIWSLFYDTPVAYATTVTFSTAGNSSWQVPAGVTSVTVKEIGRAHV